MVFGKAHTISTLSPPFLLESNGRAPVLHCRSYFVHINYCSFTRLWCTCGMPSTTHQGVVTWPPYKLLSAHLISYNQCHLDANLTIRFFCETFFANVISSFLTSHFHYGTMFDVRRSMKKNILNLRANIAAIVRNLVIIKSVTVTYFCGPHSAVHTHRHTNHRGHCMEFPSSLFCKSWNLAQPFEMVFVFFFFFFHRRHYFAAAAAACFRALAHSNAMAKGRSQFGNK